MLEVERDGSGRVGEVRDALAVRVTLGWIVGDRAVERPRRVGGLRRHHHVLDSTHYPSSFVLIDKPCASLSATDRHMSRSASVGASLIACPTASRRSSESPSSRTSVLAFSAASS